MQAKHTPGPWKRSHLTIVDPRGMVVAQVSPPHHMLKGRERDEDMEWARGNARLISAAPDLLEALQLMVKQFTKTPSNLKDSEARIKAHAALAKAMGAATAGIDRATAERGAA